MNEVIEKMNEVIKKLKDLIDAKLNYEEEEEEHNTPDEHNTPSEKSDERKEAERENGRLLSLLFSLSYKYTIKSDGDFNPNIKDLEKYMTDYSQKIDSQSKLDIAESLARIFIEEKEKNKAIEYVKEYIYTLFKEMYSDVEDRKNEKDEKIKLFSFRSFTTEERDGKKTCYAEEDVINNKLTLCNPEKFNDPFDTLLLDWLGYTIDRLSGKAKKIQELKKDMCKFIKARSFVLSKNDDIENLPQLMWAHYANDHKGFCIKYEFDKDFFYTNDEKKSTLVWRKINYVHNDFQYSDGIRLSEALFTKSDIWSYENELRLLMFDPSEENDYVSVPLNEHARITDIYLGEAWLRDPKEKKNKEEFIEKVKKMGICLYEMKKNNNCAFKLDCKLV